MVADNIKNCGAAAVVGADPPQTPEHLGHVAAEDAPVGMDFVDDHVPQVLEKINPGVVIRAGTPGAACRGC